MDPSTGVVFSYDPRPGAEQQIYDKISDITISMKALDYLKMPECIFVNHEVERPYPHLVRLDMELRTLSADKRQTLAAGTKFYRHHSPHCLQKYCG